MPCMDRKLPSSYVYLFSRKYLLDFVDGIKANNIGFIGEKPGMEEYNGISLASQVLSLSCWEYGNNKYFNIYIQGTRNILSTSAFEDVKMGVLKALKTCIAQTIEMNDNEIDLPGNRRATNGFKYQFPTKAASAYICRQFGRGKIKCVWL